MLGVSGTRIARPRSGCDLDRGFASRFRPLQGARRNDRGRGVVTARVGREPSKYHPPVNRLAQSSASGNRKGGGSGRGSNPLLDELAYRYFLWRCVLGSDRLCMFAVFVLSAR